MRIFRFLSLSQVMGSMAHASIGEGRALSLLNSSAGIVRKPTVLESQQLPREYLVAAKPPKKPYSVSVTKSNLVRCTCKGFRFAKNISSHSVAVAEKERILNELIR